MIGLDECSSYVIIFGYDIQINKYSQTNFLISTLLRIEFRNDFKHPYDVIRIKISK